MERAWWTHARGDFHLPRAERGEGEGALAATAAATDGKSTKEMLDRRAVYFGQGGEGEAEGGEGEEQRLSPAA